MTATAIEQTDSLERLPWERPAQTFARVRYPRNVAKLVEPTPVPQADAESRMAGRRVKARRELAQMLRIMGEPFFLERHGRRFYIRHRHWSLMGAGSSAIEAYKNLLIDASETALAYGKVDRRSFDADALAYYRFLLRLG